MSISRIALALLFCTLALSLRAEDDVDMLLDHASRASATGQSKQAIEQLDKLLDRQPKHAAGYYLRGREHFRLGQVKQAAADFDRFVQLQPEVESRQWERGIADYYNGDFDKGAKQFALYQTYHNNDVENAVWRYLCMAAAANHSEKGLEKARAELLPIENDRRVPMMQVYAMYRGKMAPDKVIEAAQAGELSEPERNAQLFYAHLYVGLYHAAQGQRQLERQHILAAEKHTIGHYMWDVAHVHAQRLRNDAK